MLEAIPTNLLCTNFRLEQENKLLGELDPAVFRCRATLELEEGTYDLYRERFLGGDYILERDGQIVARAIKPSAFRNKFEIALGNRLLQLKKVSSWSRKFGLFENGQQIGGIYPQGIFSKRSRIDLPGEWPLANRAFMFWLAFLTWKQESAAAS